MVTVNHLETKSGLSRVVCGLHGQKETSSSQIVPFAEVLTLREDFEAVLCSTMAVAHVFKI